ncbi:hypothetical protein, partial [Sulfoacidibacillus thermotolerans]
FSFQGSTRYLLAPPLAATSSNIAYAPFTSQLVLLILLFRLFTGRAQSLFVPGGAQILLYAD